MIGVVGTPVDPADVARNLRHIWRSIIIGDSHTKLEMMRLFLRYPESEEEKDHRERLWDWDDRFDLWLYETGCV